MTRSSLPNAVWRYVRHGSVKHLLWAPRGVAVDDVLASVCGVKVSPYLPKMIRWGDLPEVLCDLPECRICLRVLDVRMSKMS